MNQLSMYAWPEVCLQETSGNLLKLDTAKANGFGGQHLGD